MIDERIVKYQQGELSTEEVAQLLNDAEQDACDRQNGDGQHEAAANPLEHTENLIFHICDPFPPRRSLHIPPKTL